MLVVVMSVAEHTQSVVAVGMVIVHAPEFVVPTLTLNAAVPLFEAIDAPVVPQPLAATLGAVFDISTFVGKVEAVQVIGVPAPPCDVKT